MINSSLFSYNLCSSLITASLLFSLITTALLFSLITASLLFHFPTISYQADPLDDIAGRMFPNVEGLTVKQPFYNENHQAAQVKTNTIIQ